MVFSSTSFLFGFLPLLLAAHFALPARARNPLLLVASLLFYAWGEGLLVGLMGVSIALNTVFGWLVARQRQRGGGAAVVAVAVVANLSLLGWFKYANWAVASWNAWWPGEAGAVAWEPVHLPIGISFFTFQALSYVVDVYRGRAPVQRNPLHVALYISLFPQLIAGPIVRFRDVAGQLAERHIRTEDFAAGVRRFSAGLAKKLLVANTLAVPADAIFALPPDQLGATTAWLGVTCYTLQIYYDFSGYSDMAIGLGRMLGFRFPENFRYPYASTSVSEFWRRWHISLSTWFRDYLYVPLGGNRRGPGRTAAHLFVVFLLCGLWHGASWTFVLWGLYHGAFLSLERVLRGRRSLGVPAPFRLVATLLVVMGGWVLFRAENLAAAGAMWSAMAGAGGAQPLSVLGFVTTDVAIAGIVGVLFAGPTWPVLAERWRSGAAASWRGWAEAGALAVLLLACCLQLSAGTYNPFLYFRF
ncbi:MAG: MBOAT family protein [Proteobacteria bacterium]|nr:MBOAT family protein [Pseudomonadota bacterium]